MAIISCTMKLFEQSKWAPVPVPEIGYQALYGWHAHMFRSGDRKNCLMLINDQTRYQVLLHGVKREHFQRFDRLFIESLAKNMRSDGFPESAIESYISGTGSLIFTKTHDRSVLGSLNEQIKMAEAWMGRYLPSDELHIVKLNQKLNHSVVLKIKEIYPREALRNALGVNNE